MCFALEEGWSGYMGSGKKKTGRMPATDVGEKTRGIAAHPIVMAIIITVIGSILTGAIVFIANLVVDTHEQVLLLSQQVNLLSQTVEENKGKIETLTKRVDKLDYTVSASDIKPSEIMKAAISAEYNNKDGPSGAATNLAATSVVAYNEVTGEEYTVERFADIRLLLPYTNDGQEIVFYGQFNESGQWDGNCTLNVYVDDELILITDATYEDGTLLKSKQVFFYELKSGEDVWAYSDRVYEDGVGTGDTYLYEWTGGHKKDFALDDVTVGDVLYADGFIESLGPRLEAYYSGNTSDGLFNDDSGDAYMVYFFEDGTVRLLYSGNFKDGTFEDDTGNAWYIVKENDTDYMYYKGHFRDGREYHNGEEELGRPPLTLEEIQDYIGEREYGVELRWAGLGLSSCTENYI